MPKQIAKLSAYWCNGTAEGLNLGMQESSEVIKRFRGYVDRMVPSMAAENTNDQLVEMIDYCVTLTARDNAGAPRDSASRDRNPMNILITMLAAITVLETRNGLPEGSRGVRFSTDTEQ
jgi:hypothetical protein